MTYVQTEYYLKGNETRLCNFFLFKRADLSKTFETNLNILALLVLEI